MGQQHGKPIWLTVACIFGPAPAQPDQGHALRSIPISAGRLSAGRADRHRLPTLATGRALAELAGDLVGEVGPVGGTGVVGLGGVGHDTAR
jgi:hypothetical protein